ncbi:hypothetical protein ACP275_04G028900 [Erythranthe tilingii]
MSTTTSTFVSHQGLQSCLDPFLLQPRVILHQLSPQTPPPPLSTLPFPKKQPETPLEKIPETDKNYAHPLIKNSSASSSCLSLKSLEMCTESLGSETGSGIDLNIDELRYLVHDDDDDVMEKQSNTAARIEKAKAKKGCGNNFPPPLSSIAGGDGVQVKTHREGGRLVIKAFSFSSSATCFRAEREDGRLRLSLLKDSNFFEAENEELEDERVNGDEPELCICEESDDDVDNDEEEEEEEDSNGGYWKVGGVNGGGDQWSTSSRWCNGGTSSRKRLPSLPFCVAIS